MKVAVTWDEIESGKISKEAINDPYIQAFAQKLMDMSNELNESEDNLYIDIEHIKEKYQPAIREFIGNTTGL